MPDTWKHLRARPRSGPLLALALSAAVYTFAGLEEMASVFLLLCLLAAFLLFRAPRWVSLLVTCAALLALTGQFVFTLSNGPQDSDSDRDEAVETAAAALLDARNPWSVATPRGSKITTGPTSVLLAAPSVAIFRRVNELTFVFYSLFFGFLLAGDLRRRSDSFILLSLFFMLGLFGFRHTLHLSLDELTYAYLFIALAWVLLERDWTAAAGSCLGIALCARTSYGFPVAGFIFWFLADPRCNRARMMRLAGGAALGALLVILPFVLAGREEFLTRNSFLASRDLLVLPWTETNPIFRALNAAAAAFPPGTVGVLKTLFGLGATWFLSTRLRTLGSEHPFWSIAAGAFVSNLLVYSAALASDYYTFFVVPSFMAVAWSRPFLTEPNDGEEHDAPHD